MEKHEMSQLQSSKLSDSNRNVTVEKIPAPDAPIVEGLKQSPIQPELTLDDFLALNVNPEPSSNKYEQIVVDGVFQESPKSRKAEKCEENKYRQN